VTVATTVIPGRAESANPESRDSGFDAIASPRNDGEQSSGLQHNNAINSRSK
jgi:hypothetical protein